MSVLIGCTPTKDPTSSGQDTGTGATSGALSVLSYNVHGLPSLITGDDTPARMSDIAPRLQSWDLAGLQEDWDEDNHETLVGQTDHPLKLWFDETLSIDRYYGSGLSILSRHPAVEVVNTHYTTCSGILDGASDCLASKGFQAARLRVGAALIDLYNTHLEAGGGQEDNEARAAQVDAVIEALQGWSSGQAVIFTGDFNLHASDPEDAPLLERLQDEGGLVDACESVNCDNANHIDRIFIRSSAQVHLNVLSWADSSGDFLDANSVDLSDHPPISASVEWSVVD